MKSNCQINPRGNVNRWRQLQNELRLERQLIACAAKSVQVATGCTWGEALRAVMTPGAVTVVRGE